MCVCDYQFSDEGLSDVTDRLKEMLDIDAAEEDLDTRQEMTAEIVESSVAAGKGRSPKLQYGCKTFFFCQSTLERSSILKFSFTSF